MSKSLHNHPDVIVFPPVILATTLVLACMLQWLWPLGALATNGVYELTRNPLYTGGAAVMIGIAFIFALDWLVLLMAPALLILHFGVVHREEEYLEQKFGDSYREYKASVPRYGLKLSARSQRQVSGTH